MSDARPLDYLRAGGVTFGPTAAVDAAAAAAVLSTARALADGRRPRRAAALGAALAAAYAGAGRPAIHRWFERGVTIDAPVEQVWPWLAQIGQDRGGFYSYDWLENLAGCRMHSADEIHPEWQEREVGDTVDLHPFMGMPCTRFEPPRAFGIGGWGTFVLEPLPGGRCRISEQQEVPHGAAALFYALLVEFPHFVMEQRMFAGIKRRAERRV